MAPRMHFINIVFTVGYEIANSLCAYTSKKRFPSDTRITLIPRSLISEADIVLLTDSAPLQPLGLLTVVLRTHFAEQVHRPHLDEFPTEIIATEGCRLISITQCLKSYDGGINGNPCGTF